MLQLPSALSPWWRLEPFSWNVGKLFSKLKLVTDNLPSILLCSSQLRSHWKFKRFKLAITSQMHYFLCYILCKSSTFYHKIYCKLKVIFVYKIVTLLSSSLTGSISSGGKQWFILSWVYQPIWKEASIQCSLHVRFRLIYTLISTSLHAFLFQTFIFLFQTLINACFLYQLIPDVEYQYHVWNT